VLPAPNTEFCKFCTFSNISNSKLCLVLYDFHELINGAWLTLIGHGDSVGFLSEADFLVRVHPDPCPNLIRDQIYALLVRIIVEGHPCPDLNFAGFRQKKPVSACGICISLLDGQFTAAHGQRRATAISLK
jgi:hypothetical protein